MFHRMQFCSTSLCALRLRLAITVIELTLLATSACTRSNTHAGDNPGAALPTSPQTQVRTTSAPVAQPLTGATSELAELQQKVHSGDPDAMYRLGRIYAAGLGVPRDYREAVAWYRKAAAGGNTDAMYSLGEAYERGTGVREDIQQAVNWYDQATLRGNKAAKAALDRLGESFDR
jgi:TPR repeat protein